MIVFQVSSSVSNFDPVKEILKIQCQSYILIFVIFKDFKDILKFTLVIEF